MYFILNKKKIKLLILTILIFDFIIIILGWINKYQSIPIITSNISLLIFFIVFRNTKKFNIEIKFLYTIPMICLFPLINPQVFNIPMHNNFFLFYLILHTLISNIIFLSFFQIYYDFTYELKNYISVKKRYITILCFLFTLIICYLNIKSTTIYNNHNIFEFIYYFFLKLTGNVIVEEIFFRVILLSTLYNFFKKRNNNNKKSILFSILLTFIIWTFLHNWGFKSLAWYISAIIMHILFSLNYIYNKNLILNMFLHALINLSNFIKYE